MTKFPGPNTTTIFDETKFLPGNRTPDCTAFPYLAFPHRAMNISKVKNIIVHLTEEIFMCLLDDVDLGDTMELVNKRYPCL